MINPLKILTILPYKENYTKSKAQAAAIWVYDFLKFSRYKKDTLIIGNTNGKNYLSKKTDIIIFSDGPRLSNEKKHINNVIKFCKNIKSFRSVKIIERKKNIGLSRNIIKGVSKVLKEKKKRLF